MEQELKRTPLASAHERLGAKMVPFGGWYMPVQYSGLMDEHQAVRTKAGLFDVSHMGEFRVKGPEAEAYLNYLTVNNVSNLMDNQCHYTLMATPVGTVVDDLLIYRFSQDEFLLVVNAANIEKDFQWAQQHTSGFNVTLVNESERTGQIAIQGPLAETILQRLTEIDLSQINYYWFAQGEVAGVKAIVSRTGYTGEDGFECYMPADSCEAIWEKLMAEGKPDGLLPAGLGARDTLRLEARMHLYGNDMDNTTTVLEAGLAWVLKLKKKCDFVGKAFLKEQKKEGVSRKLVGFEMIDRGIARHGYPVVDGTQEIGVVTSGTKSPTLNKNIGLAYVPVSLSEPGSEFNVQIRNKVQRAVVVKGSFYSREKDHA